MKNVFFILILILGFLPGFSQSAAHRIGGSTISSGGGGTIVEYDIEDEFTAGENLSAGDLCYNSAGSFYKADASLPASSNGQLAICTENITSGNTGTFLLFGKYVTSGLTEGIYYVSTTAGDITPTAPSTEGEVVRIIGYAESSTVLRFHPSSIWIEL